MSLLLGFFPEMFMGEVLSVLVLKKKNPVPQIHLFSSKLSHICMALEPNSHVHRDVALSPRSG